MAATVLEALKGISAYPVPKYTLVEITTRRGIHLTDMATPDVLSGKKFRLSRADVLLWLSLAPNIAQGGQSYSFTDEQRMRFRNEAKAIFGELGENGTGGGVTYGYKGSRL